jgi:hypothetical protein
MGDEGDEASQQPAATARRQPAANSQGQGQQPAANSQQPCFPFAFALSFKL